MRPTPLPASSRPISGCLVSFLGRAARQNEASARTLTPATRAAIATNDHKMVALIMKQLSDLNIMKNLAKWPWSPTHGRAKMQCPSQ